MPLITEPRVVRLSWRPSTDEAGAHVKDWVERLKKRLRMQREDRHGRRIQIEDVNTPGADRAALRESVWTDFVAAFTVDYCAQCGDEIDRGDANELADAWQRRGTPGQLLWVARLEAGDLPDFWVGDALRPWHDPGRWTVLPAPPDPPLATVGHDLDRDLQAKCVEPLRSGNPAAPTPETHP